VGADPRVEQLIQRLEALENGRGEVINSGNTEEIERRLAAVENRKHSQRVLLVDGRTGTVIDDETYESEPIVLDVQKFIRAAK